MDIYQYLSTKKYPIYLKTSGQKRNFRRLCKNYYIYDAVLYKDGKRVLNDEEVNDVLKSTHTETHGGHLGINKTYNKIKERYYHKALFEKVQEFVLSCDSCQRKSTLKKIKKPLHPIQVSEAFTKIGMDVIGPLEKTNNGNKYILVFTEYLTKWVDAQAIPDKNAKTVLRVLIQFVCAHGVPEKLITDQGREFCNQLNDLFCKEMGITYKVASSYHPPTGGHTERLNRTLSSMLVHNVNENHDDWDVKIPYVLFAYRTAEHSTTKQTPFFLVYGRRARLPIDVKLPSTSGSETELNDRLDTFLSLSQHRESAAKNIRQEHVTPGQDIRQEHVTPGQDSQHDDVSDDVLRNSGHEGCTDKVGSIKQNINKIPKEGHIPLKKRKVHRGDDNEDVKITGTDGPKNIFVEPVGPEWQNEKSRACGLKSQELSFTDEQKTSHHLCATN